MLSSEQQDSIGSRGFACVPMGATLGAVPAQPGPFADEGRLTLGSPWGSRDQVPWTPVLQSGLGQQLRDIVDPSASVWICLNLFKIPQGWNVYLFFSSICVSPSISGHLPEPDFLPLITSYNSKTSLYFLLRIFNTITQFEFQSSPFQSLPIKPYTY